METFIDEVIEGGEFLRTLLEGRKDDRREEDGGRENQQHSSSDDCNHSADAQSEVEQAAWKAVQCCS